MVPYKTLEEFEKKCHAAVEKIQGVYREKTEQVEFLKEDLRLMDLQLAAVRGQIETLQQLMDTENNPPISDIPYAGDNIEELFDKRLDGPEGLSEEEVHEWRQEEVYKKESMDVVEMLDALNKETASGEETESDS
jgi:hypothetical protein